MSASEPELPEGLHVLKNTQNWNPQFVSFEFKSPRRYSLSELHALQTRAGYDPRGYGLFNLQCQERFEGGFIYTWACSASCE